MAGQAKHKMKTMSGGSYDSQAHGGVGKAQKNLPGNHKDIRDKGTPGKGAGYDKGTPHTATAVVADGIGHGRGYQTDAHTTKHHGRSGEAVGHKDDFRPMDYKSELYSEGRPTSPSGTGPTFVDKHDHDVTKGTHVTAHPMGLSTKADHHPPVLGATHKFSYMNAGSAHGYGHGPSQCDGPLRNSGHKYGHQVGKRK
jgi:hypothetical protein